MSGGASRSRTDLHGFAIPQKALSPLEQAAFYRMILEIESALDRQSSAYFGAA